MSLLHEGQFWTLPVQIMQSSQEHQGIGSSGQSGSIRQESEQTLKSQVIDLIQLESETNR